MYLARLTLNRSRTAVTWAANPYRIHQRLMMAYDGDPRLLFRLEEADDGARILVQAHRAGDWDAAFSEFHVLAQAPEEKAVELRLVAGQRYRFRLLANPTVKTKREDGTPTRQGLMREEDQLAWLRRKLQEAGAEAEGCIVVPRGLQRSRKNPAVDPHLHTHYAVLFEGLLWVTDPVRLREAVEKGIGSAKGYGFGLLSLGPG